MAKPLDVDAYLGRINYTGPRTPTYDALTHPASFFTHNILASAVTQEGRVNIMNQGVHIIRNGAAEPSHLADRKALRTLIAQHFGFDLPELETMKVDAVPDWQ